MGGGPDSPSPSQSFGEPIEDDHLLEPSIDGSTKSILSDDLVEITHPAILPSDSGPPKTDSLPKELSPSDNPPIPTSAQSEDDHPKPYKLRWSKSKVYIHPTKFFCDNTPGYLGILQRDNKSFYLSWILEQTIENSAARESWLKLDLDPQSSTDDDVSINVPSDSQSTPDYSFSIPINSIHSVILTPPTLSSWHGTVTINVFCGPTLPKLYFHDDESRSTQFSQRTRETRLAQNSLSSLPASWGGEALLIQLRRFAEVCQSAREPGLFLLNPSRDEREEHSTPIFSDDALLIPNTHSKGTSILHESLRNDKPAGSMDDFTFNILSSFSKLTQNAKSAAQMVLSHRLAKPIIPHLPQPIASLANGEPEFIRWSQQAGVEGYDVARVYLAKWASIVAAQGELSRRAEFNDWDPEPTSIDSDHNIIDGGFEMIHATYKVPKVSFQRASTQPIELEEFAAWQDDSGKLLLDKTEGRRRIFQRGVARAARKLVWLFLLEVYDWESTAQERELKQVDMIQEYEKLKAAWETEDAELKTTATFQEEAHRIEIDCRRTDRTQSYFAAPAHPTSDGGKVPEDSNMPSSNPHVEAVGKILMTYNMWEKELGYVQGMSDLCAPLYIVFEADEAITFFAFARLMEKMKGHFLRDQSGMRDELSRLQQLLLLIDPQLYRHFEKTNSLNLFFCFRWILISFKREFEFPGVLKVWEALWTDMCGPHSDLFLALAILQSHREPIIRYLREFDEVLKYVNDMANNLDCDALLTQAQMLYLTFKSIIETRSIVTSDGVQAIECGKRTVVVTDELKSLL